MRNDGGKTYEQPVIVLYDDGVQSACGIDRNGDAVENLLVLGVLDVQDAVSGHGQLFVL